MVTALIISVSVAIIFIALFFDERGSTLDYRREIKDQDEKIRRLEASSLPVAPKKAEICRPVDDQDLWDLTPALVADAVKFNGYVPSTEDDRVVFMIQGERYSVATDRLPYMVVMKSYSLDSNEYDMPLMREAAARTGEERLLGKVSIPVEGDRLTFYVTAIEHKYGHFRDVLNEYIKVIADLEAVFGNMYSGLVKQKEERKQLETQGIHIGEPRPGASKVVS